MQSEKVIEQRGFIVLEIIDNGIGMTKDGMDKLFKPFSQADKGI